MKRMFTKIVIFAATTFYLGMSSVAWGMNADANQKTRICIHGKNHNTFKNQQLILMVMQGNVAVARALLSSGANINVMYKATYPDETYSSHTTLLHQAAVLGNKEMMQLLLSYEETNIDAISMLLYNQAVLDTVTPLHRAVHSGNVEVVRLLCNAGANVNAAYNTTKIKDCTALHDAVIYNRINIVGILLAYGACPRLKNSMGDSAMSLALTKSATIYSMLRHATEASSDANKPGYEEVLAASTHNQSW